MANEENTDKFLLISLDDEKSKAVAEVLSSKTCKKIINYLAENKEAGEKDLSEKLGIPINTVEYNIRKLVSSGFVRKHKNFFWSKKGKKIVLYELSNKSIVISHKKSSSNLDKVKSLTPAIILTAAGTFALWAYDRISLSLSSAGTREKLMYGASNSAPVVQAPSAAAGQAASAISDFINQYPSWEWFLFGGLVAIFIIAIVNWRKL